MLPVTSSDVATHVGRDLTTAESQQVTQWLDWTEALIRQRIDDPALLDQDLLSMVAVNVVAAMLRNQTGAVSQEVAVDDGRVVTRYRDNAATSLADLLDGWWGTLLPAVAGGSAFTVRPHFEPDRC